MAEPNRLRITATAEGGAEVLVSNDQGQVKDISDKFKYNQGTTQPGSNQNEFMARIDGTTTTIAFVAIEKELNYTLDEATAKQIYALGE